MARRLQSPRSAAYSPPSCGWCFGSWKTGATPSPSAIFFIVFWPVWLPCLWFCPSSSSFPTFFHSPLFFFFGRYGCRAFGFARRAAACPLFFRLPSAFFVGVDRGAV